MSFQGRGLKNDESRLAHGALVWHQWVCFLGGSGRELQEQSDRLAVSTTALSERAVCAHRISERGPYVRCVRAVPDEFLR